MALRSPVIYLIGSNTALAYLLDRYAERAGYTLAAHPALPSATFGRATRPAALLFASIEELETAQGQIGQPARAEVPVLVCVSVNEEVRARELGADHCLVHPLTYDGFLAALRTAHGSPDTLEI